MTASSDEEDYMSAAMLERIADVRPGIARSREQRRQLALDRGKLLADEENRKRYRPHAVIEKEKREEALEKPIDTQSKGFAMLMKMGYKPGDALGKEPTSTSALKEPIKPEMKADKTGLGHDTDRKRKLEAHWRAEIARMQYRQKVHTVLLDHYRTRKRDDAMQRRLDSDFKRARQACRDIELRADFREPICEWFWPREPKKRLLTDDLWTDANGEEEDGNSEEVPAATGLPIILNYLRCEHHYCLYCGSKYDGDEDLLEHCPGESREEHDEE